MTQTNLNNIPNGTVIPKGIPVGLPSILDVSTISPLSEFYIWNNSRMFSSLQNLAQGKKVRDKILSELPYNSRYYKVGDVVSFLSKTKVTTSPIQRDELIDFYKNHELYIVEDWEQISVPRTKKNQLIFEKKIYEEITLYTLYTLGTLILATFFYYYLNNKKFRYILIFLTLLTIICLITTFVLTVDNIKKSIPESTSKNKGSPNVDNTYFNEINAENSLDGLAHPKQIEEHEYIKLKKLERNTKKYALSSSYTSKSGEIYSTTNFKGFKLVGNYNTGAIAISGTGYSIDPHKLSFIDYSLGGYFFIKYDDGNEFNPYKYTYPSFFIN